MRFCINLRMFCFQGRFMSEVGRFSHEDACVLCDKGSTSWRRNRRTGLLNPESPEFVVLFAINFVKYLGHGNAHQIAL